MRFTLSTIALLSATVFALPNPKARQDLEQRDPEPAPVGLWTTGTLAARMASGDLVDLRRDVSLEQAKRTISKRGLGSVITASSNGNTIKALQFLLTARGHATDADGQIGPNTNAAITAFQSAAGLAADGIAGPDTLGALVQNVQQGDKNGFVSAAQAAANGKGVAVGVDGDFGPATRDAIVAVQNQGGLEADGIVGPATWGFMFGGAGGGGGGGNPPAGDCDAVTGGVPEDQTVIAAANIRVNKCLASRISDMVAAAAAAGIELSANDGWRSPETQIQTRIQNCGGSDHYSVYEKPSYLCSPPTAIPGDSRHERGLAVDFANCGWDSPVFNWMKANAGNYHLYLLNTNDEPWHWSWDGM